MVSSLHLLCLNRLYKVPSFWVLLQHVKLLEECENKVSTLNGEVAGGHRMEDTMRRKGIEVGNKKTRQG